MGYSFRFYGKASDDWFDHQFPWFEYDVQFEHALSDAQREALGELAGRVFSHGAATPGGEWLWADRFLLMGVGERYPFAGKAVTSRVADFLMEARAVCPIVDVVLRNAPGPGSTKWDAWTTATQPQPDPGPDWTTKHRRTGHYRRAIDPNLPGGRPDPVFDGARERQRQERHRLRVLDATSSDGLTLTSVDPAQLPPAQGEAAPPDGVPPRARVANHPDGARAVYAVDRDVFAYDQAEGAWRQRWTCGFKILDLAWIDDLWAVRTPDTVMLVDPSGDAPAVVGEPFGLKGTTLASVGGGRLLMNGHQVDTSDASLTILGRSGDKLTRLAAMKLKEPLVLDCERAGRVFVRGPAPYRLLFELHGVAPLVPKAPPEPIPKCKARPDGIALEPIDALPDEPEPWPEAPEVDHPLHLPQRSPDGTLAAFVVSDSDYPTILRVTSGAGQSRDVSTRELFPEGRGMKDLALRKDGGAVAVGAIGENHGESRLQKAARGYLPRSNTVMHEWTFAELDLATGDVRRIEDGLALMKSPKTDGRKRGYRDLRSVPRPGGRPLSVWSKQPYHTMRWLGADDLLVVHQKGFHWYRRGEDGWSLLGKGSASGTLDAAGSATSMAVAVVGTGKTRCTVFGLVKGKVRKLQELHEHITAVHERDGRLFVEMHDGSFRELVGLPEPS